MFKKLIPPVVAGPMRHLLELRSVSMSQVGQDYWVYGSAFNEMENGFFLDIGAHDGIFLSNTYLLEKRYHWTGICIEGNPYTFAALARSRKCRCLNNCVSEKEGTVAFALRSVKSGIIAPDCDNASKGNNLSIEVETTRIETLLRQEAAPSVIDYLSIDIEGGEECALLAFPFEDYTFNCMTIERPTARLRELLSRQGYLLVYEIPDLDCFYVHRTFKDRFRRNLIDFGLKKHLSIRWR